MAGNFTILQCHIFTHDKKVPLIRLETPPDKCEIKNKKQKNTIFFSTG